jgi:hypothetical protein
LTGGALCLLAAVHLKNKVFATKSNKKPPVYVNSETSRWLWSLLYLAAFVVVVLYMLRQHVPANVNMVQHWFSTPKRADVLTYMFWGVVLLSFIGVIYIVIEHEEDGTKRK